MWMRVRGLTGYGSPPAKSWFSCCDFPPWPPTHSKLDVIDCVHEGVPKSPISVTEVGRVGDESDSCLCRAYNIPFATIFWFYWVTIKKKKKKEVTHKNPLMDRAAFLRKISTSGAHTERRSLKKKEKWGGKVHLEEEGGEIPRISVLTALGLKLDMTVQGYCVSPLHWTLPWSPSLCTYLLDDSRAAADKKKEGVGKGSGCKGRGTSFLFSKSSGYTIPGLYWVASVEF